jgi:hypothetical protein
MPSVQQIPSLVTAVWWKVQTQQEQTQKNK